MNTRTLPPIAYALAVFLSSMLALLASPDTVPLPYLDPAQPVEKRVDDLLSQVPSRHLQDVELLSVRT